MTMSADSDDNDLPDASDLLDFELIAKSQPERRWGLWLWVGLIVVMAGAGWVGWMVFRDDAPKTAGGDGVPIILGPKEKLKVRPADPGGMKVPDRDKLVYNRLSDDANAMPDGVERLLPPPETPLDPPKQVTPPPQALEPEGMAKTAPTGAMPPAPPPSVIEKEAPMPTPAPKAEASAPPAPKAQSALKAPPAPKAPPKVAAGRGYLIQVSAVRDEQAAKAEWARLAKKYGDILGSLEAVIERADLGARGIFYRVRGGWFATRAEAKAACDELARRNVGCIIVKP